jgi:hypothetical protein
MERSEVTVVERPSAQCGLTFSNLLAPLRAGLFL